MKKGDGPHFAGTALRVLRTYEARPPFSFPSPFSVPPTVTPSIVPRTPPALPSAVPDRQGDDRGRPRPSADKGKPLFLTSSTLSANGTTWSARLCRITVPGFTVFAVPHFFHAGQRRTNWALLLLRIFMATAPPREEPTITCGWCLSNSCWAIFTASWKSSSGSFGLMTSWPSCVRYVGLMPPGTDCQPWRKRMVITAILPSSRKLTRAGLDEKLTRP